MVMPRYEEAFLGIHSLKQACTGINGDLKTFLGIHSYSYSATTE